MNLQNGIIESVSTRKDGSIKIIIGTPELGPQQMAELFSAVNRDILQIDLPEDKSEKKSKSERLRGVLFRLWEAKHKDKYETFELFYNSMMEKIITQFKDLIN